MQVSDAEIRAYSSTAKVELPSIRFGLYNVKIIAVNPTMALSLTISTVTGKQVVNFQNLKSGFELEGKFTTWSVIQFSDTNAYNIYVVRQLVKFDTQEEYDSFKQETDLSLVPVDNVVITSPLDANDNVKVNADVLPGEIDFIFTTSTTANTITQLNADTTVRDQITILASTRNSATVNIGNSTSPSFPLVAGASVTIRHTSLSKLYAVSSGVSQTLYVISGGT